MSSGKKVLNPGSGAWHHWHHVHGRSCHGLLPEAPGLGEESGRLCAGGRGLSHWHGTRVPRADLQCFEGAEGGSNT